MTWNVGMKLSSRRTALSRSSIPLMAVGLIALGFSGCGNSDAVKPRQVYAVKGKVLLLDGTPLKSGRVCLVSTTTATEYGGTIGSDGSFEIKTNYGDGAPEGSYKVRIDPEVVSGPQAQGKPRSRKGAANLPFPAKYADEGTSDLTVTVIPENNTLEPFKLVPGSSSAKSTAGTGKGLDRRD